MILNSYKLAWYRDECCRSICRLL